MRHFFILTGVMLILSGCVHRSYSGGYGAGYRGYGGGYSGYGRGYRGGGWR